MKQLLFNIALTLICILSSTTAIQAVRNFESNKQILIEKIGEIYERTGIDISYNWRRFSP